VSALPKLVINPTSSSRRELTLSRTLVSIGRDPSNDLVLPDALVSRRHAVIECRGQQYFLRDCNSSNGSLVNGDRVSEHALKDGDLLAIGTARLLFREAAEAEDPAAKVVQHPSAPRLSCPGCRADYRKGDAFCRQCGTALPPPSQEVACPACGKSVILPAKFCSGCGAGLPKVEALEPTRPRPIPAIPESAAGGGAASDPGSLTPLTHPPKNDDPQAAISEAVPEMRGVSSPPPSPLASAAAAPRVAMPEPAPRRPAPPPPSRLQFPETMPSPLPPPRPSVPPRAHEPAAPAAPTPAGFGPRLVAGLFDAMLVGAGQLVLVAPAAYYFYRWSRETQATPTDPGFLPIFLSVSLVTVAALVGIGYYVYFWGVLGSTPGKRAFGLTVQGTAGPGPIGPGRALLRLLGYALSGALFGIGFLMIAFGGYGLHDRLASTRVVRGRERM
jgi:uncharacterized RDD family membrane protein YckC